MWTGEEGSRAHHFCRRPLLVTHTDNTSNGLIAGLHCILSTDYF